METASLLGSIQPFPHSGDDALPSEICCASTVNFRETSQHVDCEPFRRYGSHQAQLLFPRLLSPPGLFQSGELDADEICFQQVRAASSHPGVGSGCRSFQGWSQRFSEADSRWSIHPG